MRLRVCVCGGGFSHPFFVVTPNLTQSDEMLSWALLLPFIFPFVSFSGIIQGSYRKKKKVTVSTFMEHKYGC